MKFYEHSSFADFIEIEYCLAAMFSQFLPFGAKMLSLISECLEMAPR